MANTYSQVYLQFILTVRGRKNFIPMAHKDELYKYITGIVQKRTHKLICINGMPDHIHIFVGLKPAQSMSSLAEDIKVASNKFIKKQKWGRPDFAWQKGFGVFSYSKSDVERIFTYIQNQEAHHLKIGFKEEFLKMLKKYEIEYDERYLFEFYK